MRELVIQCDDGDIVLSIDDDGVSTKCVDFNKLDQDLALIDSNKDQLSYGDLNAFDNEEWDNQEFKSFILNLAE